MRLFSDSPTVDESKIRDPFNYDPNRLSWVRKISVNQDFHESQ